MSSYDVYVSVDDVPNTDMIRITKIEQQHEQPPQNREKIHARTDSEQQASSGIKSNLFIPVPYQELYYR